MTDSVNLKWSRNQFKTDYAMLGGNIYLHNVYQTMDASNYLVFENHYHSGSTAKAQGGGIYYLEEKQDVRMSFTELATPITPASEFSTLASTDGEGGAFYISCAKYIEILIEDTTVLSNTAGTNGGGFFLATAA